MTVLLGICLIALSACSNSGATSSPAPTSSAAAASTEPSAGAGATSAPSGGEITFHAYNVHLDKGAEPGAAEFQALVANAGDLTVTLKGSNDHVEVCPLSTLGAKPDTDGCTSNSDGVSVKIKTHAVDVRVTKGTADLEEISVAYPAVSNVVMLRLPNVIPKPGVSACKDEGCNPFFELTPFRAGDLKAIANWDGIATGSLHVVVGDVTGHAYSAGGEPYPEAAKTSGSSDQGKPNLHVTAHIPATQVAVALENDGARPLLTPTLEIIWP
jgi:hypothetical protein